MKNDRIERQNKNITIKMANEMATVIQKEKKKKKIMKSKWSDKKQNKTKRNKQNRWTQIHERVLATLLSIMYNFFRWQTINIDERQKKSRARCEVTNSRTTVETATTKNKNWVQKKNISTIDNNRVGNKFSIDKLLRTEQITKPRKILRNFQRNVLLLTKCGILF